MASNYKGKSKSSLAIADLISANKLAPDANYDSRTVDLDLDLTVPYRVFFRSIYYLCLAPFRVEKLLKPVIFKFGEGLGRATNNDDDIRLKSSLPQKMICSFGWFFAIFEAVKYIELSKPRKWNSPSQYFRLFFICLNVGTQLMAFKRFYFNSQAFVNVISQLHNLSNQYRNSPMLLQKRGLLTVLLNRWTTVNLSLITLAISLVSFRSNSMHRHRYFKTGNLSYWKQVESVACTNIFFSDWETCQVNSWTRVGSTILAIPAYFGSLHYQLSNSYQRLHLLTVSLSLWTCSKLFSSYVLSTVGVPGSGRKLYEKLLSLRELSEGISEAVGSLVTAKLVYLVVYYAVKIDSLLQWSGLSFEQNVLRLSRTFGYLLIDMTFLMFSADVCKQVTKYSKHSRFFFVEITTLLLL